MQKDYYGKCGSCIHCDLSSGYTFLYSTDFKCLKTGYRVKADEKICSRFEIAKGRSNKIIAEYDK